MVEQIDKRRVEYETKIKRMGRGLSSLDELMDYYYNEVFKFEDWGKTKEELWEIFSDVILKNFRGLQDDIEEAMWNKMVNKW